MEKKNPETCKALSLAMKNWDKMILYMYICILHTYIYIYHIAYIYIYIYVYIYTLYCTCIYICIHIYIYMYIVDICVFFQYMLYVGCACYQVIICMYTVPCC